MKSIKEFLPFLAAATFLIVYIFLPLGILEIGKQSMVGRSVVEALPESKMTGEASTEMSLKDRIKMLGKSVSEPSSVAVTYYDSQIYILSSADEARVMESIENFLETGLVPALENSSRSFFYYSLIGYMDILDRNQSMSLWNIHMGYENMDIIFLMDAETFVIYEYIINVYETGDSFQDEVLSSVLPDADSAYELYANYLGLSVEEFPHYYNMYTYPNGMYAVYTP